MHAVTNVLGVSQACCWEECCVSTITCGSASAGSGGVGWDKSSSKDMTQPSPTPPTQRRLAKSFSVTPSAVTKGIEHFIFWYFAIILSIKLYIFLLNTAFYKYLFSFLFKKIF